MPKSGLVIPPGETVRLELPMPPEGIDKVGITYRYDPPKYPYKYTWLSLLVTAVVTGLLLIHLSDPWQAILIRALTVVGCAGFTVSTFRKCRKTLLDSTKEHVVWVNVPKAASEEAPNA